MVAGGRVTEGEWKLPQQVGEYLEAGANSQREEGGGGSEGVLMSLTTPPQRQQQRLTNQINTPLRNRAHKLVAWTRTKPQWRQVGAIMDTLPTQFWGNSISPGLIWPAPEQ